MPEDASELAAAKVRSRHRLQQFLSTMPASLNARDDAIAAQLKRDNSSGKSKLRKIYALLNDVGQAVAPHVACGKGCAYCCKMNVSISEIEAERLSAVSGRPMVAIKQPTRHTLEKFSGSPCPFLADGACTVYDDRPYACRSHHSFDVDAHWCHPDRSHRGEMSLIAFGGASMAYQGVVAKTRLGGFADIRDFFPS